MTWTAIAAFLQLVLLGVSKYFERDQDEKARKELLHAKLAQAVKDHDTVTITAILDGSMRQ